MSGNSMRCATALRTLTAAACLWAGFETLQGAEPAVPPAPAGEKVAVEKITLDPLDPAAYKAELAKHKGKIVLVDFWATWCTTCLEQLPHTVAVQEKYRAKGVVVLTIAMDEPDAAEAALKKLRDLKAGTRNFRCAAEDFDAAFATFGIENGSLPHYAVFDRDGKLVKRFISGEPDLVFDAADIDKELDALLAK